MKIQKILSFILFPSNYYILSTPIPQIRAYYNIFDYNKKEDIYHYGSTNRKKWKKKNFHHGTIEDHHIIPRQFSNHSLIQNCNFDTSCSNNIICMPALVCKYFLQTDKLIYHHSHHKYNEFVKFELDNIYDTYKDYNDDIMKYQLLLFLKDCEYRLINNDKTLPW